MAACQLEGPQLIACLLRPSSVAHKLARFLHTCDRETRASWRTKLTSIAQAKLTQGIGDPIGLCFGCT